MTVARLDLDVPDLARSRRLFVDLLGGRIVGDTHGALSTAQPEGAIVTCRETGLGPARLTRLVLEVDDPAASGQHVRRHGHAVRRTGRATVFEPSELGGVEIALVDRSRPSTAIATPAGAAGVRAFDHVCLAVHDLAGAVRLLRTALGGSVVFGGHNHHNGTLSSQVDMGGGTRIELLQPMRHDAKIARFMERRGATMHHLTWQVADVERAVTAARGLGFEVTGTDLDMREHWRETYLRPRATLGMLVQLAWTDRNHEEPLGDLMVEAILDGRVNSDDYDMQVT